MVRHTKPLSGGGKDKFLRAVVQAVEGVADDARRALTLELTQSISEVRVRREAYDRIRDLPEQPAAKSPPAPATKPGPKPAPDAVALAFDPFAFSAVAILTRKGRGALLAELNAITSIENLRRVADAQHLSLDPSLTDIAAVREAMVVGAERRIAERKAAAS